MAGQISVSILCRHCWRLLKTIRVTEGSRSGTTGSCTCPSCKKLVKYTYNGCNDTFYAS